jgi:fructose-1,6-bisphosphatase I
MAQRPLTLIEHITRSQQDFPEATGAFTVLMQAIGLACKVISREVNQAGLGQLLGLAGRRNIQGEEVARLDDFANETMVRTLKRSGSVCAMASEELAVPIKLPPTPETGSYAVVFDPLDGSSNIDVAVSVGTIFGIYRRRSPRSGLGDESDLTQSPSSLVAAGYALYGSSTMFVYSAGRGVHGFTLDPNLGELLLSHPDVRVPPRGKILSVNLAYRHIWSDPVERAVSVFQEPIDGGTRSLRYVGSLVADAHRTLLKGGLFLYPEDEKKPEGKLRLLYEAGPLAFLFEQAGGRASDGRERILAKQPESLHDRTPLVIGSSEDVELYERTLAGGS